MLGRRGGPWLAMRRHKTSLYRALPLIWAEGAGGLPRAPAAAGKRLP
jgi:hypothetical protein